MSASLADQLATTALGGANADFIEELYQRYLTDPESIDLGWAQ
jgi:2-oxoglutarate dehydrogenase E1 component